MSLEPVPVEALSPAARKFAGPGVNDAAKGMAARGLAPLQPKDLASVLAFLAYDPNEALAKGARKTLSGLPERMLEGVLKERVHASVLHVLARELGGTARWAELLLLNPHTEDETVLLITPKCEERQLEIIAQNETRLLRAPRIIEALYLNPRTRMSTVDRVIEFAVRSRLELTGIPAFKEVQAAILGVRFQEEPDEAVDPAIAAEAAALVAAQAAEEAHAEAAAAALAPPIAGPASSSTLSTGAAWPPAGTTAASLLPGAAPAAPLLPLMLMPVDAIEALSPEEVAALAEERGADVTADEQAKRQNIQSTLIKMTASQRVRWAVIGNKEVRGFLMRDSNKMVAAAAIKSPRVTEQEIITVATSRSVNDEVIRVIGNSRDWTKTYQVRLNLVSNPKCPLPKALHFLRTLRANDVRNLAKSKNISSAVASAARRMASNMK